ncbi:MAG: T9SS type A sorting domain-containing protein [Prevotellaceae bacterium]|nr:T9SS type A sorting domain-containing protein [Prevotellaceae bacterium]
MSQTLFNQDDKWEWVNQIIEDDKYVGFQVMQEGDVELFNLRYEEEFSKNADVALSAWIMDDKVYLAVRSAVQNDLWDVTYSWYFYLIDNSAEKTNIKYVGKVKGLSAMPTIVERSTPVTVEFGDNTEATHEIIVTSASGQVLQRQKVVAGQNSVSLNTSRWSKGLNIVTTKNSDNETESCKIIVK